MTNRPMVTELLITTQVANLTATLFEALHVTGDHPVTAARLSKVKDEWAAVEPEARASVLQALAWHARSGASTWFPNDWWTDSGMPKGCVYADHLRGYAEKHTGTAETFLGDRFPMLPLAGPCGLMTASLAFDRDDLGPGLEAALLLAWLRQRDSAPVNPDERFFTAYRGGAGWEVWNHVRDELVVAGIDEADARDLAERLEAGGVREPGQTQEGPR